MHLLTGDLMCFLDQYYEVEKDIFALYRQQKGWKQTSLFEQKGMIALANKDFASPFPPELYVISCHIF